MEVDNDKIRRAKSCLNDSKKKNLFYRTNFWNFQNLDSFEKSPEDGNTVRKLQRINMFENVFVDDNSNNELNNNMDDQKNRFSHNNYANNLKLNFSYNDNIIPNIRNKNRNYTCCNCDKYDSKPVCK